jgi:hypothetical protein
MSGAIVGDVISLGAVNSVNGITGSAITLGAADIAGITSHGGVRVMDYVPAALKAGVLAGSTSLTSYLSAAIEAAIAAGGGRVILPASQSLTMATAYSRTGITVPVVIEGAGAKITRIRWSAGTDPGGNMIDLRGDAIAGALEITFPVTSNTFTTERPSASITVDAEPGDRIVTFSSVTDFAPGRLVRLKAQRLWQQDPRNSIFYGELLKVKAVVGSTVEFFTPLAFGYKAGNLAAGTAQAGSSNTVTLAAGASLDPLLVQGCRIRIVSGTGAGQQRYITAYDNATKVATIETGTSYPQPAWSPVPDATSGYEIDGIAYATAARPAPGLTLRGFTLDGAGIVNRALVLDWCDGERVEDVALQNFDLAGLYSFRGYEPRWIDIAVREIPGVTTSLGYGTAFNECRDAIVTGLRVHNCRRGTDALGSIPTVRATIGPFMVSQGETAADGTAWSADRRPTGLGSHSQAYEYTWHTGSIDGVATGVIVRGVKCTVRDVDVSGDVSEAIFALWATDLTIDNVRLLGRSGPGINPPTAGLRYGRRHLAYISTGSCQGTMTIRNCYADELPSAAIYLANAVDAPITTFKMRARGSEFEFVTDSNAFLLAGDNVPDPAEWEFSGNIGRVIRGAGTYVGANLRGNSTQSTWNKISDTSWWVKILDDGFVSFPVVSARQDQVMVSLHNSTAFLNPQFFGVVREGSASTVFDVAPAAAISRAVAPFTGTTNADGSTYIGFAADRLWVENRSGATLLLTVTLVGGAG